MLNLPTIQENDLRAWMLAEVGIPTRLAHLAAEGHWQTLGELMDTPESVLLDLQAIGPRTCEELRTCIEEAMALTRPNASLASLPEWIQRFLSQEAFDVLSQRYGLYRTEPGSSSNWFSLQELANRRGVTRERIRQIEKTALDRLRTKPARLGFESVAEHLERTLHDMGGCMRWKELDSAWTPEWLAGITPSAVPGFLADLLNRPWHLSPSFLSVLPTETVTGIQRRLDTAPPTSPTPITKLTADWMKDPSPHQPSVRSRLIEGLMDDHPGWLRTPEGDAGTVNEVVASLAQSLLLQAGEPIPLRRLCALIQQRTQSLHPVKVGAVREALAVRGFAKTPSGYTPPEAPDTALLANLSVSG